MKKKSVAMMALVTVMAASLTACSGGNKQKETTAAPAAETTADNAAESTENADSDIEPIELMAGCTYNTTSASYRYCEEFAEELKNISGGKMTINWNPASTLGNTTQHYAMLKEGTLDMFSTAFDTASTLQNAQDFNALVVPYIFDDQAHYEKFMESDLFQKMLDDVEEPNNVKLAKTAVHFQETDR